MQQTKTTPAATKLSEMELLDETAPMEPKPFDEEPNEAALDLFKKKSIAISKLAGISSSKRKAELKKIKEEKDRQMEMFRQKRERIQKEKENKRKMSLKLNKIQLEFKLGGEKEVKDPEPKMQDIEELSVSSGESGQVFIHNLMGFWT